MLQRAMTATQSSEPYEIVVENYRRRFTEYHALLRAVLDPKAATASDAAVTLLMHAYEQVTASSAAQRMVRIVAGGRIARQFVADNLDFVRHGLPRNLA
jgi:hypothetical protein